MRLDVYLVSQGLAASRTMAQKIIAAHAVTVDGRVADKPSEDVPDGEHAVTVRPIDEMRYVGRGGLKLEAALSAFHLSVGGLVLADIGASTGGFTDCLLQHGASRVYCVDAGHGQLHPRVATDGRVRSLEGCNARYLTPAQLVEAERAAAHPSADFRGLVDGAVMDVSFISQTCIHPALTGVIRDGGFLVTLIKPQFEAGSGALSKGGIVKREADRRAAVNRVTASAAEYGFSFRGVIPSPIPGGDGNTEYVAYFIKQADEGGAS